MFFDGSVRSTRSDQPLAADLLELALLRRAPPRSPASSSNSRGSTEIGWAVTRRQVDACGSDDIRADDRDEEVVAPAVGVEADDVVREQPLVDRARLTRLRQDGSSVRAGPGNVDEVRERRVRPRARARAAGAR